jgi:tripartite-type tricarboxylate transporter receptor subunit TctC
VKAGKLRALALNGPNRLPALPDVPTLTESGIPFDLVGWHALFAPAGTPPEIVERLAGVVNRILAMPDVRARMFEVALFPVQPPTTPQQWSTMFREDVQAWAELVRSSSATIN